MKWPKASKHLNSGSRILHMAMKASCTDIMHGEVELQAPFYTLFIAAGSYVGKTDIKRSGISGVIGRLSNNRRCLLCRP
eukprot:609222-Pyramimonas_sp.AAC.1